MANLKRTDLGIGGSLIVLAQIISSVHHSNHLSYEIKQFKEEFRLSIDERNTFFVRKSDVLSMQTKIDEINNQLVGLKKDLKWLKDNSYVDLQIHPEVCEESKDLHAI